jgi:hypothetical protein
MPRLLLRWLSGLGLLALLSLIAPRAMAIEEPEFQVVRPLAEQVELRRYAPYVVAEVILDTAAADAGREAFPILAGYIFGKNKGQRKMEMTAPVTQAAAPMKMEMTAPVTQSTAAGGMRVQFVLPRAVALAEAPEPLDPRVRLREEPGELRAVIRYSGMWTPSNYEEHLARLRTVLATSGLVPVGEPVLARYNGPMTPWFLRRNEVWIPVAEAAKAP